MMSWSIEIIRYGIVGLVNTAGGLAIIFLCMSLGMDDILANLSGYAFGFITSFILNGKWTFRQTTLTHIKLIRFILVTFLAYSVNLLTLLFIRDHLDWGSEVGQLSGVVAYTLVGFLGMKFLTFKAIDAQHGNG